MTSHPIRKAARGQPCTVRLVCLGGGDPDTTVLAHFRMKQAGVGMKPHDMDGAFACHACHEDLHAAEGDQESRLLRIERMLCGLMETHKRLREMGIISVKGEK